MGRVREIWMSDGKHLSGWRTIAYGVGGLFLGSLVAILAVQITDPCGPSTGNPDADFCLAGLAYGMIGAGAGALGGLALGIMPTDRWVLVYPEPGL